MEVLNTLGSNADRLIIWHLLGPAALAVYSIAAAPVIELRSVLLTVTSLVLPKFVKMPFERVRLSIYSRLMYYWIVVLLATLAYVLAAPFLFRLLFPAYTESIVYTQIFALVILFLPKNMFSTFFLAHVKVTENYIANILGNAARIVFCFVLIPAWGLLGAIAAFLIAQIVDGVITWYLFERMRQPPSV